MAGAEREHIALFIPSLRGGGAEGMMVNLARGLVERDFAVDLVVAKAEGPYLSRVGGRVRLIDLGCRRTLRALPGLARYLRRERPAALLSAMDHANVVALLARGLARVPTRVVVSVRTTHSAVLQQAHDAKRKLVMPFLIRRCYPWADGVVAISQGVAADLVETMGIRRESVRVIYNPVVTPDLERQAAEPVDHPWFAPGELPVILGVGRLTAAKDFPLLLRAFDRVRRECAVRLVILGEGEQRPHLERLVRELDLEQCVRLPGFVDNPYAYMSRAAVFVLSSAWEGFSNVVAEALACGTPVVSTDCPHGPAEILEGGKHGRLVPVGDTERLAEAIVATLAAPPDREAVRQRGRVFSLERSVTEYLAVLEGK